MMKLPAFLNPVGAIRNEVARLREERKAIAGAGKLIEEFYRDFGTGGKTSTPNLDTLVATKGPGIFRDMYEREEILRIGVDYLHMARLSTPLSVTPRSTDPIDMQIAAAVDAQLDKLGRFRLMSSLKSNLYMGHWCAELHDGAPAPWKLPDGSGTLPMLFWESFASLPQETLRYSRNDRGQIDPDDGIWQIKDFTWATDGLSQPGENYNRMSTENMIVFYWNEGKFGTPYGSSLFRTAYRYYKMKQEVFTYYARYLQFFGMPLLTIDGEATGPEKDSALDILKGLMTSQRAVLPDGQEIKATELSHTAAAPFRDFLEYCDGRMRNCVYHPKLMTEGGESTGSNALGQTHSDTFGIPVDNYGKHIEEDVFDCQFARPFVARNFGESALPPHIKFDPYRDKDRIMLANLIGMARKWKLDIGESWVRKELGIPEPEDGEDILDAPMAPPSFGPPSIDDAEENVDKENDAELALFVDLKAASLKGDPDAMREVLIGNGRRSGAYMRDLAVFS